LTSLDAYSHLKNGKFYISGSRSSESIIFAKDRSFTSYATFGNGATGNLIGRVWSNPVHVMSSTVDYKYAIIPSYSNFEPVDAVIEDDYRMFVIRYFAGGTSAVASSIPGSFGVFDNNRIAQTASTLEYKCDDNTVGYESYFLISGVVKPEGNYDGDRESFPVWLLLKPEITVLGDTGVIAGDELTRAIAPLIDDAKLSDDELASIQKVADSTIASLSAKKKAAEDYASKCGSNTDAKELAEKAADYYQKAIDNLYELKNTNDVDEVKRLSKLAKNYEVVGDYYLDAADKKFYGLDEQADADIANAEKILDSTQEYEPSMWFSAGSWLGDAWQSFKEGFGMGDVPDWVLILVVVILVVGGAIIVLKLF